MERPTSASGGAATAIGRDVRGSSRR
jgi:hypothetical protein